MGETLFYIPLEECVNDYLDESEQGISKAVKCHNLAFRLMTELGLDAFYKVQTVELTVLANKTVVIPNNLQWTKVGVKNERGDWIPLKQNDKLIKLAANLPDRITKVEDNTIGPIYNQNWNVFCNYWNGFAFVNLYGIPSGGYGVGQFSVDVSDGVIILNPDFAFPYVLVEGIIAPDGTETYYVPIQFKEAIIAGLAWLDIRNMPNGRKAGLGDKRDRRHEYYNQRRLALARFKPYREDQAYETNLENIRLTIKG